MHFTRGFVLALLFGCILFSSAQASRITAVASSANLQASQTEQLTATVTAYQSHLNFGLSFTVSFNATQVANQSFQGLNFIAGQPLTETFYWQVPANSAVGTYTVTVSLADARGKITKPLKPPLP